MIRATQVRAHHHWIEPPADTVVLDFDDRHRRRMAMRGTRGLEFLLDLETTTVLRGGDALVLDDNRLIEVVAAPEPLIEIRGSDSQHLVRVAWHLGNRHLPTQIAARTFSRLCVPLSGSSEIGMISLCVLVSRKTIPPSRVHVP